MSSYEILSLSLEIGVLITLWVEFFYDKWWNDQEQRRKRRAKRKLQFEQLTQGEHR